MSARLVGPWPLEAANLTASTRVALAEVGAALRAGQAEELRGAGRAEQPGLYLILQDEPRPALSGFWIVFGPSFLDDGPLGPPEAVPPYASGLLDAATEEVWWKNLPVAAAGPGLWRPLIVLEWLPPLAVRSSAAPPGVVVAPEQVGGARTDDEGWLDARLGRKLAAPVEVQEERAAEDPYAGMTERRGLIAVLRGELRYTRALHTGSWRLVPPAQLGPAGAAPAPMEAWLAAAAEGGEAEVEGPGPPLEAPGGRVAFPLSGWLTRSLELWPERGAPIRPGALAAREVATRWKTQVARALGSMIAVLIGVGGLAAGVRLLAEPRPQPLALTPTPAPQPAMSVCSADHQAFVEELRCQVASLAGASDPGATDPVCGDAGGPGAPPDTGEDLQASYCGLLDRGLDGWTGNRAASTRGYNFGHLALSQACFNVLGRPSPYTQPTGYQGGPAVADPARFLEDPDLSIASLVEASQQLQEACDQYRARAEARVEGAIFATHIGEPFAGPADRREPEPAALRRALVARAESSLRGDATRCFEAGVEQGPAAAAYRGLCGAPEPVEDRLDAYKIWRRLGAEQGEGDVIARYASARFGLPAGPAAQTDSALWRCHLTLSGALPAAAEPRAAALWDLLLPVPQGYDLRGAGARSQLVLDAGMRGFEAGLDAGVCWDLVKRRVIAYTPAHPLLASLSADGWPSVEQRLCGQVCAAAFRLAAPPDPAAWTTPQADLGLCLDHEAPAATPDLGFGGLDRLRLPPTGRPWQRPTDAQICAFNLVAQGYFPAPDGGLFAGGRSPVEWAGETAPGSRIAGGAEGLAADAISGMARYGAGTGWSVGRCDYVATQCFSELLLEVTGDPAAERYEWVSRWSAAIGALSNTRPAQLALEHPWCAPLQPYLGETDDMAQIDTPCRRGVALARQSVEQAARSFAARSTASNGGGR